MQTQANQRAAEQQQPTLVIDTHHSPLVTYSIVTRLCRDDDDDDEPAVWMEEGWLGSLATTLMSCDIQPAKKYLSLEQ